MGLGPSQNIHENSRNYPLLTDQCHKLPYTRLLLKWCTGSSWATFKLAQILTVVSLDVALILASKIGIPGVPRLPGTTVLLQSAIRRAGTEQLVQSNAQDRAGYCGGKRCGRGGKECAVGVWGERLLEHKPSLAISHSRRHCYYLRR